MSSLGYAFDVPRGWLQDGRRLVSPRGTATITLGYAWSTSRGLAAAAEALHAALGGGWRAAIRSMPAGITGVWLSLAPDRELALVVSGTLVIPARLDGRDAFGAFAATLRSIRRAVRCAPTAESVAHWLE